jgi:hypothetical protein
MPVLFLLLTISAIVGVIRPYVRGAKRWHFAAGALTSFLLMAATIPPPTPQELFARKAQLAAEQAAALKKNADEKAVASRAAHEVVAAKVQGPLAQHANYTKSEYPDTLRRVGSATFSLLNSFEPGAAFAAAESSNCNQVTDAEVSDLSKPGSVIWFVDCENGNRFMVDQASAKAALARYNGARLSANDLSESCTLHSVALCKASPAQRGAKSKEIEFVSACDIIVQNVVVSPSSLNMASSWAFEFGKNNEMIVRRAFDSQNAFGAMIRSQYRCVIDASTSNIKALTVQGPTGNQRVI